jgi:cyclopropane fatty-acyl-phospholipid synthase-like methyltransferase
MTSPDRVRLRQTFGSVAELYHAARPRYPDRVLDALVGSTGLDRGSRVLEVGCGTGQATVPMAERGLRVTAVELSADLARVARRNLAGHPETTVQVGDFEEWPPADGQEPFDAVVSATAWHWIDPEARFRRAWELLRDGGHLAWWTAQHVFPEDGDPFFREIQEVYDEIGEGQPAGAAHFRPGELPTDEEEVTATGLFEVVRVEHVDWETTYDADGYLALLDTFSGHIAMGAEERAHLYREIRRRLALRADGRLRRHWGVVLQVCRRRTP